METQRAVLDVAARNVALSQTASPAHPVHELEPVFATPGRRRSRHGAFTATLDAVLGDAGDAGDGLGLTDGADAPPGAVRMVGVSARAAPWSAATR